jgi:large subunit ribosomal protein L22
MKATLKNYRQSPRKVRLVADMLRGKPVERALALLSHADKKASVPLRKLLASAVANAKDAGARAESLYVSSVSVDKGVTIKRFMPRARGSASAINRRASHITLTLGHGSTKA